jgi:hypothetical protein
MDLCNSDETECFDIDNELGKENYKNQESKCESFLRRKTEVDLIGNDNDLKS